MRKEDKERKIVGKKFKRKCKGEKIIPTMKVVKENMKVAAW